MPARTRAAAGRSLALALCAGLAGPAASETITLSLPEGRLLAQNAALAGRPELARRVAAGLLEQDPDDRTALIVLAAVEPVLGRPDQGRMAGARAFRVSEGGIQKFEAARLTARAATAAGDYTLAQVWLRRAALHAPDDDAEAAIAREFALLRRLNPWSLRLDFRLAPSNNVNGGSRHEGMELFGLPFEFSGDAQALSGWVASADAQVGYRLHADADSRTVLTGRIYLRAVSLSDAARDTAPEVENADLSTAYLSLGLDRDWRLDRGSWGVDARVSATWYGGDHAETELHLGAGRRWQTDGGMAIEAGAAIAPRWSPDGYAGLGLTLSAQGAQALDAGRVSFGATLEQFDAETAAERYRGARVGGSFTFAEPAGPARIGLAGGVGRRDYPDYPLGRREDLRLWAQAEATFTEWDFAGFAPVATLTAGRTESTIDRFDRDEVSLGLSLRSTF